MAPIKQKLLRIQFRGRMIFPEFQILKKFVFRKLFFGRFSYYRPSPKACLSKRPSQVTTLLKRCVTVGALLLGGQPPLMTRPSFSKPTTCLQDGWRPPGWRRPRVAASTGGGVYGVAASTTSGSEACGRFFKLSYSFLLFIIIYLLFPR